ncbi:MAG: OmpA family protein [Saprospiraceae bacterium]|nr:OmpA family protein [Saprospiraceae bacterium]
MMTFRMKGYNTLKYAGYGFCWMLMLCMPLVGAAQYQEGMAALAAGEFQSAKGLFEKEEAKSPFLMEMGMAHYFSAAGHSEFNLEKAYNYALKASRTFRDTKPSGQKAAEKVIGRMTPTRVRRNIELLWYQQAMAEGSLAALTEFLERLPRAAQDQRDSVTMLRNELAFASALEEKTLRAFKQFFIQCGDNLRQYNPIVYQQAGVMLYDAYVRENGWEDIADFKKYYAYGGFAQDLVAEAYGTALKQKPAGLFSFVENFDGTIFAEVGLQELTAYLYQEGGWKECALYLEKMPDMANAEKIWERLYTTYRKEHPEPSALDSFELQFPGFPQRDWIERDKPTAIAFFFETALNAANIEWFQEFLTAYPDYPEITKLENRFYTVVRAAAKDPKDLDVLLAKGGITAVGLREQIIAEQKEWALNLQTERFNRIVRLGRPTILMNYALLDPPPVFAEAAKDKLVEILVASDSVKAMKAYLERLPEHPGRGQVLRRLYDVSGTNRSKQRMMDFAAAYPDFDTLVLKMDMIRLVDNYDFSTAYHSSDWDIYVEFLTTFAPTEDAFFVLQKMMYQDFSRRNWSAVKDTLDRYSYLFAGKSIGFDDFYTKVTQPGGPKGLAPLRWENRGDYSGYAPAFTKDGKQLYFCRNVNGSEDIYYATHTADGWTVPEQVRELNSDYNNEAPEDIDANGTEMLLFVSGTLFESKKTSTGWIDPVPLPDYINFGEWNGDANYFGRGIIYVSGPAFGNRDIFVSLYEADGKTLGEPFSLGEDINTGYDEREPFLHPDMKTLYFASAGHEGFGSYDIYVATRLDDTWKNWSKPRNLGLIINSEHNEWNFLVTTDGLRAYTVKMEDNSNSIMWIDLPADARPEKVYTFETAVLGTDGKPIEGTVVLQDLSTGEIVQILRPDPLTGKVFIPISEKKQYRAELRGPEAPPISLAINFDQEDSLNIVAAPVVLATTEELKLSGASLPINNLFFETGSYTILEESRFDLDALAGYIVENNLRVEIQGHTDDVGTDDSNQLLSEYRAAAVRDYLIKKGCAAEQIATTGFGESRPVVANTDDRSRQKNRRVEFRLL